MADFTPAMVREDGANRIAKTAGQSGAATAAVIVGQYAAQRAGWNGELPTEVFGAVATLLTVGAAWVTNRSRLKA